MNQSVCARARVVRVCRQCVSARSVRGARGLRGDVARGAVRVCASSANRSARARR